LKLVLKTPLETILGEYSLQMSDMGERGLTEDFMTVMWVTFLNYM
jgi:hypothetical protein